METDQQKLIDDGYMDGKKSFEFLWEKIENYIKWDKIYLVMKTLDWRWHMGNENYGIPTGDTIKKRARELLFDVYEQGKGSISTGGLYAGWDDGNLYFSFTIEDAHTCDF